MSDDILKVSWSRLKTWEHCKQKAWLQSTGHRNPSGDVRVFFRGTVTDRILREWLQDDNRDSWSMADRVEEFVSLCQQEQLESGSGIVRWKSGTDKQESIEWCKTLLDNSVPLLNSLVVPYLPDVEADKHLKTDIIIPGLDGTPRKIQMIGILDIFIDAPELLAIYDLKATENENYYKTTIAQLVFYHVMVKGKYRRAPSKTALIQPMCQEKIKPLEITEQHELNLMHKIIDYAHSIWRNDVSPKESDSGCLNYCDVSHACEKFKRQSDGRVSWT
jgi:hypothetical protein